MWPSEGGGGGGMGRYRPSRASMVQISHMVSLEDKIDIASKLDVFQHDPAFAEHEAQYAVIKRGILGEMSGSDDESASGSDVEGSSGSSSDDETSQQPVRICICVCARAPRCPLESPAGRTMARCVLGSAQIKA